MDLIDGLSIGSEIFFVFGLPGENENNIHDTIKFREIISRKYKNIRGQTIVTHELEPGSPIHLHPEEYGIVTHLKTFKDYYHFHSLSSDINSIDTLGYYIDNYFSEKLDHSNPYSDFTKKIMKIKCQYLCSLHKNTKKYSDPRNGRKLCDEVSKRLGTKRDLTRPF